MVDGGGLENHCTGNGAGGSNPSPSAKSIGDERGRWGTQNAKRGTPIHAAQGAITENETALVFKY